ncbi:DUF2007 domain-containing protein [Candidatus Bipolaricaulota bacterium]|nr:DUF2007 domain-containing protein [Candidatus Bipolaricaulota bacterium]
MKLRELVSTFNQGDIAIIKSLLESEGIDYLAHGDNFNQIRPFIQPVRFMVAEDMLERAQTLIEGISLKRTPISLNEPPEADQPTV